MDSCVARIRRYTFKYSDLPEGIRESSVSNTDVLYEKSTVLLNNAHLANHITVTVRTLECLKVPDLFHQLNLNFRRFSQRISNSIFKRGVGDLPPPGTC